jgi:hypothetical protein
MDDDTNYYREPDEVISERLIDDTNYFNNINCINDTNYFNNSEEQVNTISEDPELEMALKESLEEYKNFIEAKEQVFKEEKRVILELKPKIQRLLAYDKPNQIYYEIILNVLETYENQIITVYSPNEVEYTYICFLLKKIRLKKEEQELLHKIIIFE